MANIKDVAQRASVSVTTASFVLSGRAREYRISKAAAERVMKAADALNYRPNYHARTFKRGRSDILGFPIVLQDPNHYRVGFWQGILTGVDLRAREEKCDVLLIGGDTQKDTAHRALESLRNNQVDGLTVPAYMRTFLKHQPHYANLHIVYMGDAGRAEHPVVTLNPNPGIRAAVEHLADLGHRGLQFVACQGKRSPSTRTRALQTAGRAAGLRFADVNIWSQTLQDEMEVSAYIELCRRDYTRILKARKTPTAIVCANELVALGVQAALRERGMEVPGDVSLIGFDNIYAQTALPRLTVISHMLEEIGQTACELAMSMVGHPKVFKALRRHVTRVPAELIVGASTAPPP